MICADIELARRIEAAEAAIARACNESQPGGAILEAGGGLAVFAGAQSPLTHVVGMGLSGPVREPELEAVEAFFHSRGARVTVDLCPLADPGLVTAIAEGGYRVTEFNNVLVKPLAGWTPLPAVRVRPATAEEGDLWSHAVGEGFFDQERLTEEEMDIGRAIFAMPGARCYLALAEEKPAGGAALAMHGRLATLFADSTIARFRRQGLHRELIAARLNAALEAGCDLATASVLPGGGSQRNYERLGFQIVYTKVTLVR